MPNQIWYDKLRESDNGDYSKVSNQIDKEYNCDDEYKVTLFDLRNGKRPKSTATNYGSFKNSPRRNGRPFGSNSRMFYVVGKGQGNVITVPKK